MALSKRRKAIRDAEIEADRIWQEKLRLDPLPPPPPWTLEELGKIDRMETIVYLLRYEQPHDLSLVSEFLALSYLFEGNSHRVSSLRLRASHYKTLSQNAAKESQWLKIHDTLSGLTTELSLLRNSRDRLGRTPQ